MGAKEQSGRTLVFSLPGSRDTVDVPVVEARPYSCCVPIIDSVPAVSGRCAVANVARVPAAAGASPVDDIHAAGSVVDPHWFHCGSGSSMLDQSYSDLGPDPGLHEGRSSYGRDLQLLKQNI